MATTLVLLGWLQSLNGSVFPAYSQALKLSLHLTQTNLDTIAFFSTLGSSLGLGPSLLYNHLSTRSLVLLGLIHSTIGYFFTWLAIQYPDSFSLPHLCLFQFLSANAQTYIQTATLLTGLNAFPNSTGFVVGYLKGFVGLSASILLQFFAIICNNRQECMPFMLSWLLPLLSVVPILGLSTSATTLPPGSHHFQTLTVILVTLAVYQFSTLVLQATVEITRVGSLLIFTGMCVILLSPVIIFFIPPLQQHSSDDPDPTTTGLLSATEVANPIHETDMEKQLTWHHVVRTLNFWLLFMVVLLGTGCTASITSNLAQLGHSLGYSPTSITLCVSLSSVCGCLGKILSGIVSERYKRHIPRPIFLAAALGMVSGSLIVGSMGIPGALFLVAVLEGTGEGSIWCLAIAVASDLFGLGCFGSVLNMVGMACPVGDLLLSVWIVGPMYDSRADQDLLCLGYHCFRDSFLLLAVCSLVGAALSLWLARRKPSHQLATP